MNLITLEEAKDHLLVDHDADDTDIERKIQEASEAVMTYLDGSPIGQPVRNEQGAIQRNEDGEIIYMRDAEDELIVRYEIKAAVKLLVGELYKHREGEQDGEVQAQY